VSSLTTATAIAAGLNHSMALKADGTVVAWGSNGNGQIGDGTSGTNRLSPVAVSGVGSAVAIAAGTNHSLALKSDGPSWRGEATPAARSAMAPRTTTA
jgi:alpha-tubulin suppressor-like RCC1 family protein